MPPTPELARHGTIGLLALVGRAGGGVCGRHQPRQTPGGGKPKRRRDAGLVAERGPGLRSKKGRQVSSAGQPEQARTNKGSCQHEGGPQCRLVRRDRHHRRPFDYSAGGRLPDSRNAPRKQSSCPRPLTLDGLPPTSRLGSCPAQPLPSARHRRMGCPVGPHPITGASGSTRNIWTPPLAFGDGPGCPIGPREPTALMPKRS